MDKVGIVIGLLLLGITVMNEARVTLASSLLDYMPSSRLAVTVPLIVVLAVAMLAYMALFMDNSPDDESRIRPRYRKR